MRLKGNVMNEIEVLLYNYALSFRRAIISAISSGEIKDSLIRDFPRGCCSVASDLLQRYLFEKGIKTYCVFAQYGCGWDGESHSWLQTDDGIVIDITGDQYRFNKNISFTTPVYVGTIEDGFHDLFDITDRVEYKENRDPFINETKNDVLYKEILKFLS